MLTEMDSEKKKIYREIAKECACKKKKKKKYRDKRKVVYYNIPQIIENNKSVSLITFVFSMHF